MVTELSPIQQGFGVGCPSASPGCPTPSTGMNAKIITVIAKNKPLLKVGSRNTKNPLIFSIDIKDLCAKGEKVGMGVTVVFKDDSGINMREKPVDCCLWAFPTALVVRAETTANVTGPIDFALQKGLNVCDSGRFGSVSKPRPIAG